MMLALKALLLRWVLSKSLGSLLGFLLVFAVPIAGVLKVIGIPLLIVLAIIGLPLMLLLAVIGLPLLLIAGTVGVVVTVVGALLAASVAILKVALPVILVVMVGMWIWKRVRGNGSSGTTPDVRDVPDMPPPSADPLM